MAQAMAAAAAHSMPPFPLPALPRVRPPPIPKGTPGPNTIPMPDGPRPHPDSVWADGKWVLPKYNAAKHRQKVISKQLEKALQHEVNGMNIYAYRHRITQQVVYSLTKNMDNNKIMKQLIFHGKKTVPSAIRRDLFAPYFSVHFPKTPDGAAKGLEVFRHLRELSLRRQLDPPDYMKIVDEEYLTKFKEKAGYHLKYLLTRDRTGRGARHRVIDLPIPGRRMNKHALANRLMHQVGTSVADLAAVLTRLAPEGGGVKVKETVGAPEIPIAMEEGQLGEEELTENLETEEPGYTQELTGKEESKEMALMSLSDRALKRIQAIRKEQEKKMRQIDARKAFLSEEPGQVRLAKHTLERLSTEYEGSIGIPGLFPTTLGMIEAKNKAGEAELAFQKALNDLNAEKKSKQIEVEQAEVARIDQEIATKSDEERQQIHAATQAEKEQITNLINTEIDNTRETLKQYKSAARAYRTKYETAKHGSMPEDRRFVREMNRYLLERRAYLLQRYANWCGPYAHIPALVDEAMAVVEGAHNESIAELERKVQTELEDKLKRNVEPVLVRWANPSDGQYGGSWPESILHGELEDKAVVLKKNLVVRQHAHLDANEEVVDEQKAVISLPASNSPHVFGAEKEVDERYKSPEELKKMLQTTRESRVAEHVLTSRIQARDRIVALQLLEADLTNDLDYFDPDLRRAIKDQINSVMEPLEYDLSQMQDYINHPIYADWVTEQIQYEIPRKEAELSGALQEKLSKVLPNGELVKDSTSVMDSTVSAQAKEIAVRLADVRAELAIFKYRHHDAIAEDVREYTKFASLFKERSNLARLYPAADQWLAQDESVFQQTDSPPEGVDKLQAFENDYDFVSAAVKRARFQTDSEFVLSPPPSLASLHEKIKRLNNKLGKAVADLAQQPERPDVALSKAARAVSELRSELNKCREDRVKAIQHNNPAFDKQAWREYREQEMGYIAEFVEAKKQEKLEAKRPASRTKPESESPKPAGLLDRVKGIFSRK